MNENGLPEFVFATLEECQLVRRKLREIVDIDGAATVSDFYTLIGVQGDYNDRRWGWLSFPFIDITQTKEGFEIHLPKPERLT